MYDWGYPGLRLLLSPPGVRSVGAVVVPLRGAHPTPPVAGGTTVNDLGSSSVHHLGARDHDVRPPFVHRSLPIAIADNGSPEVLDFPSMLR